MRLGIAVALLVSAVAMAQAHGAAASGCGSALPVVPSGLPAPVVFQTGCGAYRSTDNGSVTRTRRVRSPWWSPPAFQVDVRAGHVVLIQRGKVRWRSRRRFTSPSSDFDSVAFGRHAFAFSFIRGRLWVAPLGGHEHAVGWSESALTWTKRGDLLTVRRRHREWQLTVRGRDGTHPNVFAPSVRDFLVDDATGTVVYVSTSGSLVRSDGRTREALGDLASLGLGVHPLLQVLPRNLVAISSPERLVVLRGDGSVFAAISYPADSSGLTHGWPTFAVAGDRVAVAVELIRPAPGGTAGEDVYLLRAGDTLGTRLVRLQDDAVGCGWLVTMVWRGPWLLYSDSVANVLAFDTDGGARIDLSTAARELPGVHLDEDTGEYAGLDFAVWG